MSKTFLDEIFEEILLISRGECSIKETRLQELENQEAERNILAGLKMLYEDLELYKSEYEQKLSSEYKLKILQKKNDELEQFNYMASHDLREPLRNIKNFSELILKRHDAVTSSDLQQYMTIINESTDRMYDLLNGLLNFTTAGSSIQKQELDLNNLLQELIKDLEAIILEYGVELEISELPVVYADHTLINSVFQNLITNAIKFRSPDRKPIIRIYAQIRGDEDVISICDNGIGIAADNHSKIFELLKKLHPKSVISGTGIGLSICKKIIQLHGGEIWVDSVYDKGSKFSFTIPSPN